MMCRASLSALSRPQCPHGLGLQVTQLPRSTSSRLASSQAKTQSAPVTPAASWRPTAILDEWVKRPIHPISLRQLFFFGRTLTETRLISSANYVRSELPTRLAHRLRDMQKLPYVVVTNPHLSEVYELYYKAFETLRRLPEIRTLKDNEELCKTINGTLNEHLSVIPNLVIGVLECQDLTQPDEMEAFLNNMLRARISRRVIAEQHLALTESFNSPWHVPAKKSESEFVGEVLLRCNAKEIIKNAGEMAQRLSRSATDSDSVVPEINISGSEDATLPYIQSHLEYMIGELFRNSLLAVMERNRGSASKPPPIDVLICEAPQHVIIRISDQGGGISRDLLPYLWSFNKGPANQSRMRNLEMVPQMAATVSEMSTGPKSASLDGQFFPDVAHQGSLSSFSSRPPHLRLGMGLPMSRVYAEYWAGSLQVHSLEGYGVDAFLQISKLGNQNEQINTRASVDAV